MYVRIDGLSIVYQYPEITLFWLRILYPWTTIAIELDALAT